MALVEADVIGPLPIVDIRTGADVVKGNRVVLDDERTVVPPLVSVRLIANVRPYVEKPAEPERPAGPKSKGA